MSEPPPDLTELAVEAFIYGYPLVETARCTRPAVTNPRHPLAGAVNSFRHARTLVTIEAARVAEVVCPNHDTLYSVAMLVDVGREPLVLRTPRTGGRYFSLLFMDAWTNNFAYTGLRATDGVAGEYLLVGPGWAGDGPEGMPVIHAPTRTFFIGGRLLVDGDADLPRLRALQNELALTPLSSHLSGATPAAPTLAELDLPTPDPGVPDTLLFWEWLRVLSQAYPPHPDDIAYQQRFAPLGLLAPRSPYVDPDPALAATLQAAETVARAYIEEQSTGAFPLRNNWHAVPELFNYNVHHLGPGTIDDPAWKITDPARARLVRAIASRHAWAGNYAYEAFYPYTHLDADGEPLSGEHRYVLHFDQPPPVDAFWSITMYEVPSLLFAENPLQRYAIGDRTKGLRYNADGSLDIYLQHESPGPDAESNWLPAPAGAFGPMLRMYLPRPEAFDDAAWPLPPIRRIS